MPERRPVQPWRRHHEEDIDYTLSVMPGAVERLREMSPMYKGERMKFYIHTTGCKANQWDSLVIAGRLQAPGLFPGTMADADVVVVNACAVTEGAERDARRFIGSLGNKNAAARIILTGCQGQAYPEKTFGAHTVLGQAEKFEIGDYLGKDGRFVSRKDNFLWKKAGLKSFPGIGRGFF